MFRSSVFRFSLLLAAYAFLLFLYIVAKRSSDYKEYQELVESSAPSREESPEGERGSQKREGVAKDLWFIKGGQRLHIAMKCDTSELKLMQTVDRIEVVEEMEDVHCLMQDDLYYLLADGREAYRHEGGRIVIRGANPNEESSWVTSDVLTLIPMQQLKRIDAKHARFHYRSNCLVADEVKISRFYTQGHSLEQMGAATHLLMEGGADSATFTFEAHDIVFKANKLKASFYSQRGLF